jgi:hypothetical protein
MKHNLYGKTWKDRHPIIFSKCKEIKKNPKNILSFGCSIGYECITLLNYFPESTITGVDIDDNRLNQAKKVNFHKKINYLNYKQFKKKSFFNFDIIFCMSVLCKWPETEGLSNCSSVYDFKDFEKEILFLTKNLNFNGLFVIFNSSFFFEDTKIFKYFDTIKVKASNEDIEKFDKNNNKSFIKSKNFIFQKRGVM